MSDLNIEWIKLEDLEVEPKNPKKHDIEKIMLSIERFGFINPFIKNYNTGKLLAGHGRKQALELMRKKGLTKPDQLKEENGSWLVPVVSGVNIESEEDALAYLVADNRLTELGGWNTPELLEAIESIQASTPDLEEIGISELDLNFINDSMAPLDYNEEVVEEAYKENNIYFDIMFEDDFQQNAFFKFIDYLKANGTGHTISEKFTNHIKFLLEEE